MSTPHALYWWDPRSLWAEAPAVTGNEPTAPVPLHWWNRALSLRPSHLAHDNDWKGKLVTALHSDFLHHTSNALLVMDLLLMVTGMYMEIEFLESAMHHYHNVCAHHGTSEDLEEYGDERYENAEFAVKWASVTILSLFALELLLLLIGEGAHFFDNYMQVFDVAVIAVSLYFELNGDMLAATGVMLARLWRLVRLTHGMHEQVDKAKEHTEYMMKLKAAADAVGLHISLKRASLNAAVSAAAKGGAGLEVTAIATDSTKA